MKTITKIEKIYTFEELSEDAKKRAMEEVREEIASDESRIEIYRDEMIEEAINIFNSNQIKLQFDDIELIFNCYGCSYYVEDVIINKYIDTIEFIENNYDELLKHFSKKELNRIKFVAERIDYYTQIENSECLCNLAEYIYIDNIKNDKLLRQVMIKFRCYIEELILKSINEIKDYVDKNEYYIDDEEVLDNINNFIYEFYEDGIMY